MRWLDSTVSQNIKGVRSDDRYAEIGIEHDENGRRSKYDDHRNRRNDP